MANRKIVHPSNGDSLIGTFSVQEGGTGGKTLEEAHQNLGIFHKDSVNQPNGPVGMGWTEQTIALSQIQQLPFMSVSMIGITEVRCGEEARFKISNFDSFKGTSEGFYGPEYLVSAEKGSVRVEGDEVVYTAPEEEGPCGFTIEGRAVEITAYGGLINKPTIVYPSAGTLLGRTAFSLIGSVFQTTDTLGTIELFTSADCEIFSDQEATSLTWSKYGNDTTTFSIPLLIVTSVQYVRIRYHGIEQVSAWSDLMPLHILEGFVDSPKFIAPLLWLNSEYPLEGLPDTADTAKLKTVVTFILSEFTPENYTDTYVNSDLEIATDSDFNNIVSSVYGTTVLVNDGYEARLDYNTLYFARAKHHGVSKDSAWGRDTYWESQPLQFMTVPDPRYIVTPTLVSSNYDSSATTLTYDLITSEFTPVNYQDAHILTHFSLSTSPTGTPNVFDSDVTVSLKDLRIALDYSKTYYFSAKYAGNYKQSAASAYATFTTAADDRIIKMPTINYPANNATGLTVNPTLLFSAFVPLSSTVTFTDTLVSTDIEIATNSNFTTLVYSSYQDTVNKLTVSPALDYFTNYYARIRYHSQNKVSSWSPVITFKTKADDRSVATPSLASYDFISATDTDTNTEPVTYGFQGSAFTSVNYTDTLASMEIKIATDAAMANVVRTGTTSGSSAYMTQLAYGTTYYVQFRYNGTVKTSGWSAITAITTKADDRSISSPVFTAPINGASSQPASLLLSATAFSETNVIQSTHLSSTWQLSTTSDFSTIFYQTTSTSNKTSLTVSDLDLSTTYYARVKYNSPTRSSAWSPVISFKTKDTVAMAAGVSVGDGRRFYITNLKIKTGEDTLGTGESYFYASGAEGHATTTPNLIETTINGTALSPNSYTVGLCCENQGEYYRLAGIRVTALQSNQPGKLMFTVATKCEEDDAHKSWTIAVDESTAAYDLYNSTTSSLGRGWYYNDYLHAITFKSMTLNSDGSGGVLTFRNRYKTHSYYDSTTETYVGVWYNMVYTVPFTFS